MTWNLLNFKLASQNVEMTHKCVCVVSVLILFIKISKLKEAVSNDKEKRNATVFFGSWR